MLKRLRPRSPHDVVAWLALFVALGTGGAYAANTIGSSDVIDESLLSQDIKNREIKAADIAGGVVNSGHVTNESLTGTDIANTTVGIGDLNPAARGARANGTVDYLGGLSRDKGVTGVTVAGPNNNAYCIALASYINPATATLVVSPDDTIDTAAADHPVVVTNSANSNCPTGQLEVDTYLYDGDVLDNNDGALNLNGDFLSNSPSPFTFVVP